jgi:hypothetical protein
MPAPVAGHSRRQRVEVVALVVPPQIADPAGLALDFTTAASQIGRTLPRLIGRPGRPLADSLPLGAPVAARLVDERGHVAGHPHAESAQLSVPHEYLTYIGRAPDRPDRRVCDLPFHENLAQWI